jgi:probable F420-dependent oxidoreductase
MELGLNLVMVRPGDMPGIAARAEAAGYDAVFVPDHVVFPVQVDSPYPYSPDGSFPFALDTPLYDPWVVLGTIAAATATIKLGTGVYVLPLRHPFVTARAVTSVDVLSGGRAVLGVGAGWLAEEFTALGLDPRRRFSRLEECVDVLRALWTEEQPSYHGRHFDFEAVHFAPRPASTPHPPILLGGDSDHALARAARIGDGWMSGGVSTEVAEIEQRVNAVRELRRDHGATDGFEITILFPRPTPDDLARLEDLGVDRVVVIPWNRGREAIDALEAFAATALGTR